MMKIFICLVTSSSISNQKVLLKSFLTKNERIWTRISSNWHMSIFPPIFQNLSRLSKHSSTTRRKFPGIMQRLRNEEWQSLWKSSRFSPFLSLQKEEYCVRFRWYPNPTSPAFAEIILQSIACWWVGCVCVCKQSPLQWARIVMIMGLNPSIVKNCMSRIIWQNGR